MRWFVRTALAVSLTLFFVGSAHARECEGARFPNQVEVGGTNLVLNGLGVREATVFSVNVYVAGLYVENRSRNGNAILSSEGPKRLVLHFVRDVDRSDIVEAFRAGFGSSAALRPKIQQLLRWIPAATEGARWTFTYVPGTGLEVKIGRRVRGVIEGADFARAFLGIWLGANPPNAGLKSGLLGGECG